MEHSAAAQTAVGNSNVAFSGRQYYSSTMPSSSNLVAAQSMVMTNLNASGVDIQIDLMSKKVMDADNENLLLRKSLKDSEALIDLQRKQISDLR